MSDADVTREIERGAKFVIFQYTISVIVLTFRRSSDIYFIPPGGSRLFKGLPFIIISLLFGWWGIPWGPVYTIESLANNFGGGKNVTYELKRVMNSSDAAA